MDKGQKLDKDKLRELAKKRLEGRSAVQERSADDNRKLVEELSIHQEELKIQNEELLRVQIELEASRAKYFELYDFAPVGYITLTQDLIIKESNLASSSILGTERKNLINKGLSSFLLPRSLDSLYLHYRRVAEGKEKQVHTFSVRRKDGKEVQVQFESNLVEHGPIKGFRSILTDVTERLKLEVELERTKARLEAIINQMPVGILVADAGSGEILFSNAEIDKIYCLGFKTTDIKGFADYTRLGRRHLDGRLYKTNEYPFVRSLTGEVIKNELAEILRPDGSEIFISSSSAPIYDSRGDIVASVALSIDVTESIRIQRERDRLLADLEEYSKKLQRSNADLQQFAYIASHDMKEPLRMVTRYLQLLEKKNKDKLDDKSNEYLNFAMDGANRMQSMIDDLLTYAHVETRGNPFTTVDMEKLFATVLNDLKVSITESGATITHDSLPNVTADKSQMVVLLENLVGNAIKYRGAEAPQIQVSAHQDGKNWVFSVQDNGIGIDPKHKDRIFEMFQRLHTREEYEGTGMGLALSRRIVERHGGRIWFESEVDKGSTFFFTIPVHSPG